MTKYIDKSALVAEIESKKKYAQTLGDNAINSSMQQFYDGMEQGCVDILCSIDNLDVKEVDLEKEFESFLDEVEGVPRMWHSDEQIKWAKDIAKHFFELGLKAQKGE